MRGHKPDPPQSFNLLYFLKKLGKSHRLFQIFSIRIYILSQKHDFHHSICHQTFNLPDNIPWIPAPLSSSYIGNNTIAAEIIAAKHNVDTGFKRIFPLNRKILYNLVCILPDVNDHPVREQGRNYQLCKLIDIVGAEDQIYKRIAFLQLFHHLRLLHHTAAQSDHHMGIFLFQAMEIAKPSINSLIGVFPDRTGIVDDKVCIFVFCLHISDTLQHTGKFLRVPRIHLTSKSHCAGSQRPSQLLFLFLDQLTCLLHKPVLSFRLLCRRLLGQIHTVYEFIYFCIKHCFFIFHSISKSFPGIIYLVYINNLTFSTNFVK